jgi:hypothetical protein
VTTDRPSHTLRIGGWLPPVDPPGPPPTPAEPDPDPVHLPVTAWFPPVRPVPLGEYPAHRRRRGVLRALRSRSYLLLGVAAAAAIPLVLALVEAPNTGLQPGIGVGAPPAYANPAPAPATSTGTTVPAPNRPPTGSPTEARTASPSPSPSTLPPSRSAAPTKPGLFLPPAVPSPAPPTTPAGSLTLEAEGPLAERQGTAAPRELASASGGRVVTGIGAGSDNTVRFPDVTVRTSGTYTVTFHYVATQRLRARIVVNGQRHETVQFPRTGDEWGAVGAVSVQLPLTAGSNTIEFGNASQPAPDLDRMVVQSVARTLVTPAR